MSTRAVAEENEKPQEKATGFPRILNVAIIRNDEKEVEKQISCGVSLKVLNSRGQTPLQAAIEKKNINIVKIIVDNGADIHQETRFGTPFYYAAFLDSTDLMKYFLDKGVNVDVKNENGDTALHAICQKLSDSETCTFLLKQGADPNLENENKKTPFDYACQQVTSLRNIPLTGFFTSEFKQWIAALNFISEFLDYGLDLSNILQECPYILYCAVKAENVKLVKYLMTKVDYRIFGHRMRLNEGAKTIQLAIKQKNLEIIKMLMDKEADIPDKMGFGILFSIPVEQVSCDIINYFLQKGTDVNWKDHSGNTALHLVSMAKPSKNSIEICRILLNHGAELEELNKQNYTPLQLTLTKNNLDIAKVLVSAGANVRHQTKRGNPFHLAAARGCLDIIDYFLKNGVHIDEKDKYGNTALHVICMDLESPLDSKSCEQLLKCGANIYARNNENKTPLFYVLRSLHSLINALRSFGNKYLRPFDVHKTFLDKLLPIVNTIHDFLKRGVNLDDVLKGFPNILYAAVVAGDKQLVEYLLQRNIKVDRRIDEDATLLHCAAFFGRLEVMATLIRHGANINATMNKKLTPLHLATLQGHVAFAIALMNFDADIDAQDDWGQTALHKAVWFDNAAIVWALLLRGADTVMKDMNDELACDLLSLKDNEYNESIFIETTAIASKAFFCFHYSPNFLYYIKENFQYNHDPQTPDYRKLSSIFKQALSLKENKDKILKMNKEELIEISEAKTPDSVFAQEVLLMRNTVICDNVTLCDLVTENIKKIARYFVDAEIPDLTAFSREGFYCLLQKRMNAVRRHNLFGWIARELGQRLQVRLPQEVMDEVVKYLDEHDVRNILRATFGYEGEDIFDDEKKIQEAKQEFETTFEIRLCIRNPESAEESDSDDVYHENGGSSD